MQLSDLRTRFASLSGRMDLLNDSPELIDFYLNEGSKYLDRNVEVQKTWASQYTFLDIAGWYVEVQRCRAIKEVWMSNA